LIVDRQNRTDKGRDFLVNNHDFFARELKLRCPVGIAAFAFIFTFTSCVGPLAKALQATTVPQR
jgi:hypothetical protein